MKRLDNPRFLAIYSGAVTAALLVMLLTGAKQVDKTSFDVLTVRRINVVEPDGTLRMVLANKADFPGLYFRKKERKHKRDAAGLLFFNDEGTENGGLIFGGKRGHDGKVGAGGSLTFDQYEQDQVIQIYQNESDGKRGAGLKINDVPETPMDLDFFESLDNDGTHDPEPRSLRARDGIILR